MNLLFDELENKITIPDEHWYQSSKTKAWLPSATKILSVFPKGIGFEIWLKQTGVNSEQILKEAGQIGSEVHALIDQFIKLPEKFKVSYISDEGKELYKWEVWEMFCRFMDFYNTFNPKIIAHEFSFANDELVYGGTIDCICEIDGIIWLIDYKSGNMIHESHYLQIAAYSMAWNRLNPNYEINRAGILHLKASTQKRIEGKMQGEKWKIEESESISNDFDYFKYCQKIWNRLNPNAKPKIKEFPLSFTK